MASIGKASLTIVPKFDNLGRTVTGHLDRIDTSPSGVRMGRGIADGIERGTGGLAKSGAIVGFFASVTEKAMDVVSSSLDGAVSRLDTLNNYPRVMESLGYSAGEAQASIEKMGDRLTGLPTALNDMASTVQGLTAVTGDLGRATDAGLAMNDMLLAAGSSTQLASSATEQFRQMLSKGKPEMEDWKALVSAAPGQMQQLAESMLGPTANANDLYAALGGGKNEAILSMDDLLDALIRLDTEGGEGITSFAEQAKTASGGIESSASNMQTAVTRGLAGVLDAVGSDTISSALSAFGGAFEDALGGIAGLVAEAKPYASSLVDAFSEAAGEVGTTISGHLAAAAEAIKPVLADISGSLADMVREAGPAISSLVDAVVRIAPVVAPAAAALAGLAAAGKGLGGIASLVDGASGAFSGIKGTARSASEALLTLASKMKDGSRASEGLLGMSSALGGAMGGPLVVGIGVAVAAVGLLAGAFADAWQKSETYKSATRELSDAVDGTLAPIQTVAGAYDELAGSTDRSNDSLGDVRARVDEAIQAQSDLAESIKSRNDEMNSSVGLLQTYKETINEYANQTGLDAQEQMEFKFAVEQVNEQIGTQYEVVDAANGKIADQNGVILDNVDAINESIDARQRQLRVEALEENYKDLYRQQYEDLQVLNDAKARQAEVQTKYDELIAGGYYEAANAMTGWFGELTNANKAVEDAQGLYDATTESMGKMSGAMVEAASGADVIRATIDSMGEAVSSKVSDMGLDVEGLSAGLADAGVSAEAMSSISQDAFASMLSHCGGDVAALASMIGIYNATPIVDKDGEVNVADATLVDAQGRVYTWNGTTFEDKECNAVADDTELIDAQGNLFTWNGSSLKDQRGIAFVDDGVPVAQGHLDGYNASDLADQDATAEVTGNLEWANGEKSSWNKGGLNSYVASGTINLFRTITDTYSSSRQHAAGGVRAHADGGVRLRGAGAIATRAIPLDIVGEDGAEAIVPLTNRRYSLPFAKILAEQIGGAAGRAPTNHYTFGDITIDASSLKDIETAADFAAALVREARSR